MKRKNNAARKHAQGKRRRRVGRTRRGLLRFDGGSSGNPGPAAAAYIIEVDGEVVMKKGHFLGFHTNNEAEYEALVRGLQCAKELHINDLAVVGDSELVIRQMLGYYRVRSERLKELHARALSIAASFRKISFRHIKRDENKAADRIIYRTINTRGIGCDDDADMEAET